jgi:TonB family protein
MTPLVPALVLALALAAVAWAEEPASPPAPAARRAHVITQPDWLVKPTAEDLGRVYPKAAWALGLQGAAVMDCVVEVSSALAGCRVTAESPPELGFGPAALLLVQGFRMRPMTIDGVPASGGKVRVPIHFSFPPQPVSAPQPVDPETLALARQFIAATPGGADYQAKLVAQFAAPDVFPDDQVTPQQTRMAAAEALQTALRPHQQQIRDLPALAVASILTRDELRVAVQALAQDQAPQLPPDMQAKLLGLGAHMEMVHERLFSQIQAEARAIFCKTHHCGAQVQAASGG